MPDTLTPEDRAAIEWLDAHAHEFGAKPRYRDPALHLRSMLREAAEKLVEYAAHYDPEWCESSCKGCDETYVSRGFDKSGFRNKQTCEHKPGCPVPRFAAIAAALEKP